VTDRVFRFTGGLPVALLLANTEGPSGVQLTEPGPPGGAGGGGPSPPRGFGRRSTVLGFFSRA
jgi:hypothetical protein